MDLYNLGWNEHFANSFAAFEAKGYAAARVAAQYKNNYRLISASGEAMGQVSGKYLYRANGAAELPAVGDWVVISPTGNSSAVIHSILPRLTKFSRKAPGDYTEEQVVSANIDTIFIVTALNKDFNLRRIERYLTLTWESGATPVVILNKADLCSNIYEKTCQVEKIAPGTPVHPVSAISKEGLNQLYKYLAQGNTAALLGSSGVGKSTIINSLLGREVLRVNGIREDDDKGRHTTTHRELFVLPWGGIIIDTPGMRELQMWGLADNCKDTYEDIVFYAEQCYYSDCSHEQEPKCAVKAAVLEGELDPKRLENYLKIKRELAYLEDRQGYLERKEKQFKHYASITRKMNKKCF